jgi:hypothetical protein
MQKVIHPPEIYSRPMLVRVVENGKGIVSRLSGLICIALLLLVNQPGILYSGYALNNHLAILR